MTQSYGYYCPKCKIRWRTSVCLDGSCPAGHPLSECFWIYHQFGGFGHRIRIKSTKLNYGETFLDVSSLREWIQKKQIEIPAFAEVFENVQFTSSASEQDWLFHCWSCKFAINKRGYYPEDMRFDCELGNPPCNIYCKDFERVEEKEHA